MTDRHQQKPYPLRMPEELRADLESAAALIGRSLHAEIVDRLLKSVQQEVENDEASINLLHALMQRSAHKVTDAKIKAGHMANIALMLMDATEALGLFGDDSSKHLVPFKDLAREAIDDANNELEKLLAIAPGVISTIAPYKIEMSPDIKEISKLLRDKLTPHQEESSKTLAGSVTTDDKNRYTLGSPLPQRPTAPAHPKNSRPLSDARQSPGRLGLESVDTLGLSGAQQLPTSGRGLADAKPKRPKAPKP